MFELSPARVPARPAPHLGSVPSPLLQRRCACGGTPGPDGECAACKAKRLQRSARGAGPALAPPIVHDVLRSPGRPLDGRVQHEMEGRLGHDFSRVRVHTDSRAAASARAVDALAYTVGSNVVFDAGRYAPASADGGRLLAHELTHVVQQQGSRPSGPLTVAPASGSHEREAELAAQHPDSSSVATGSTGLDLARQPAAAAADPCPDGMDDLWVTAFFARARSRRALAEFSRQTREARRILRGCCINLRVAIRRTRPDVPTVDAGAARPAGDPLGFWDYPAATEALGEADVVAAARGVPIIVVDDVPGSGGGATLTSAADAEYTGPNALVLGLFQHTTANPACNTLAHELWHVAGNVVHDPADGAITACTSNTISDTYCNAVRTLI
jgi:hypothetical protein